MAVIIKNPPPKPLPKTNEPNAHWVGMPEFEQEKQKPYAAFMLRVNSPEHLAELEELLGQKLTPKTKSAWYPKLEKDGSGMKRWT